MKKSILITSVVIVLVIVGILAFSLLGKQSPTQSNNNIYGTPNTNTPTVTNAGNTNTPTTNPPANNQAQAAASQNVQIKGFDFSPSTITIKKGDTITWTNADSASHTITSDSGSELSSSTLSNGAKYSHTFNTAGTFSYHCSFHPSMKATVIVQ